MCSKDYSLPPRLCVSKNLLSSFISNVTHVLLLLLLLSLANQKIVSAEELAKLYSKEGEVHVQRNGQTEWVELSKDSGLNVLDTVRTGAHSRAGVLFANGVLLRLNSNARLQLKEQTQGRDQPLSLERGAAHFFSRSPQQFPKVETTIMTASVRGTEFVVETSDKETKVSVLDGAVECENKFGKVDLKGGEEGYASVGQAPLKRVLLNPLDAVQWTLHLPPILELKTEGQIQAAEKAIEQADSNAKASLKASLFAQKALLALVRNDKVEAAALASEALNSDPNSLTALLASSYVEQANFNLENSRKLLNRAAAQAPNSGFISARQAELALAFGEKDLAVNLAEQALRLSPNDPYALSVLGFCALARLDGAAASQYFEDAIKSDPALGLPHLGLGLSQINQGELQQGRIELQIAAHLEPNVALYRSYLGKAFFEEERERDAAHEYERAIALDPQDPTPFLYRAYYNLSTHRPIEALSDIEHSIELNENRAIYRSKLLLDQDSAVRGAGLAQVFNAVGFSAAARNEALNSLNRDYANYSAHLLLADSYDDSELYATATLSELLLARLLSPKSFNLVRPTDSSAVSSNEFNALFDRPISRTQLEGTFDTKKKLADGRVVQSGSVGKWAYALDYENIYADGFRDNDREKSNYLYLSGQYQLTPKDTILLDGNLTTFDDGDTALGFDPTTNNPEFNNELSDYIVRLGLNHEIGPRSKIIAQLLYNNSSLDVADGTYGRLVVPSIIENDEVLESSEAFVLTDQAISFDSQGLRFDTQYIEDTDEVSIVAGFGILDSTQDQSEDGLITEDESGLLNGINLASLASNDEESQRAFLYTTWHLARWVDLNLGVNYSHLKLSGSPVNVPFIDDEETKSQWNPKVGVSFYITPKLTVRGAYFKTLGSSGIRELEIIEPTFIGGFNQQFFDIFPGTESDNYAAGFDYKLGDGTYIGAESVWRDLSRKFNAPFSSIDLDTSGNVIAQDVIIAPIDGSADEQILRSYLYKVLCKQTSATLDHIYSVFEDNIFETEVDTNRIRAGLNYFSPSGWFIFSSATWREQKLSGYDGFEAEDGVRDFWIVDLGVGYQLDKRHGQITLKAHNLFDQNFHYFPTGLESEILPGISGILGFSVNF